MKKLLILTIVSMFSTASFAITCCRPMPGLNPQFQQHALNICHQPQLNSQHPDDANIPGFPHAKLRCVSASTAGLGFQVAPELLCHWDTLLIDKCNPRTWGHGN